MPTASSPHPTPAARTPGPADRGRFLLVTCPGGAEEELRRRQRAVLPDLEPGAWRRGVVTFRLPEGCDPADDFAPDLVFARAVIRSLGQVTAADPAGLVAAARDRAGPAAWRNVHVWPRDPRCEVDATADRLALLAALGLPQDTAACAAPGDLVLDCVIDTTDRWWVGWHRAATPPSCWPGGIYPVALPADKVSRAWLKLDEAIAAFAIALQPGERACELGAAPGGSCQRLLEAGLDVVGIDPAVVDPRVAAHPRFTHWRKRSRDVKLRDFRGFDWLVCDMNIDPVSTLEAIGRVVAEAGVRPRGIVATLKLPAWSRAAALPDWLARFRDWGYLPRVRQLSTGGREVCCFATRSRGISRRPATRRPGR
jgi:23S rRNA (cytidine2498-2'-O)-methyltransferase